MELPLTLADGPRRGDVLVDCAADETIPTLARRLTGRVAPLYVLRTGRRLDPAATIARSGVRPGDVLSTDAPSSVDQRIAAVARVVVVAGVGTGAEIALAPGRHVLAIGEAGIQPDVDGDLVVTVAASGRVTFASAEPDFWQSSNGPATPSSVLAWLRHHIPKRRRRRRRGRPMAPLVDDGAGDGQLAHRLGGHVVRAVRCGPNRRDVGADHEGGERAPAGLDGRIAMTRAPRARSAEFATIVVAPVAPPVVGRPTFSFATAIAPLAIGAALYLLTKSVLMLAFMALTPIMAVWSFVEDARRGRRQARRARRAFAVELDVAEHALVERRATEQETRSDAAPDAAALLASLRHLGPLVWSRAAHDRDHLSVRVGIAHLVSATHVEHGADGDPVLRAERERRLPDAGLVTDVPLVVDLPAAGVLGLIGPRAAGLGRWITVQAAALHSPRHLGIAMVTTAAEAERWVKWLPHLDHTGVPGRALATDAEAASRLIARLVAIVHERSATGIGRPAPAGPPILVVIASPSFVDRAAVHELLQTGPTVGVFVVWIDAAWRALPAECAAVIDVDASGAVMTRDGETIRLVPETVTIPFAARATRLLAPLRDATLERDCGVLPAAVGLAEVLGSPATESSDIGRRWATAPTGLGFDLGRTRNGPLALDLCRDGPHALVAGTTGSGKSELLRSLIVSLAARYPPNRCSFLLVDYKGGAAFRECAALPHVLGMCTDLDGELAERVLVALRAEVRAREAQLARSGASDLAELEARPRGADMPARLVVIIDEFAALVREVPAFVDGVIDLAQRGRSLGMHLVLATQRPGGVVSDNIRANTNLRIALRVNEPAESSDVVGAPDAAAIDRGHPGRAFVRIGPTELLACQIACGSLPVADAAVGDERPPRPFVASGAGTAPSVEADDAINLARRPTQLSAAIADILTAAGAWSRPAPPPPWLPPLAEVIDRAALGTPPTGRIRVGLIDEPERQRQIPLDFDLAGDGAFLIVAAPGHGGADALRTVADAAGACRAPDSAGIAVFDHGGALAALAERPECRAYVGSSAADGARLLLALTAELERRRAVMAAADVDRWADMPDDGRPPRLVVIVDDYEAWAQRFEGARQTEWIERLHLIATDGPALGVAIVVGAKRFVGLPGRFVTTMRRVLQLGTERDTFDAGRVATPPGRGHDDHQRLVQFARPDPAGKTMAAVPMDRGLLGGSGEAFLRSLDAAPPRACGDAYGWSEPDNAPVDLDLEAGHFLVVGPPRSGRSHAVAMISAAANADPDVRVVDLRGVGSDAAATLRDLVSAARVDGEPGDADEAHADERVVVVLDDAEHLDPATDDALEALVALGPRHRVRAIVGVDNRAALRAYAGGVAALRRTRRGLILQPDIDDGELFGVRLRLLPEEHFPVGRGFLVDGKDITRVQVAAAHG